MGIVYRFPKTTGIISGLLLAVLAAITFEALAANGKWDWVADSILALATLIGVVTTTIVSVWGIVKSHRQDKSILAAALKIEAAEKNSLLAAQKAQAAQEQSERTQSTVDGSLSTLLTEIKKGAKAEGVKQEKDKQESTAAVVDAAVTTAIEVEKEKARKLIEATDTATAAAKEAAGPLAPIKVEVDKGPGVDSALRTVTDPQEVKDAVKQEIKEQKKPTNDPSG